MHVVVLATAMAVTFQLAPAAASHTSLDQVKRELASARSRLTALVNDDRQVLAILNQVTSRLTVQRAELAAAQAILNKIDLRIRTEERTLRKLRARAESRQALIDARARALYMAGPVNGFIELTDAESFGENLTRAGMLEYVASFDKRTLEDLGRLREQARRTREALRVERAKAKDARDEVAARVAVVADLVATQQQARGKLSARIQAQRAEIAALQREQARIEALIRSRASTGTINTGPASRMGFAWPIRGNINSPYGPRWGGFHTGIDIACSQGTGFGASKAGKVIAAEWGGGYGNMIIIDHGGGYTTLYAHLSRYYVSRGASVSQHQRIGACGATGNATGSHLHFEIRINGRHTNPRPYLP